MQLKKLRKTLSKLLKKKQPNKAVCFTEIEKALPNVQGLFYVEGLGR